MITSPLFHSAKHAQQTSSSYVGHYYPPTICSCQCHTTDLEARTSSSQYKSVHEATCIHFHRRVVETLSTDPVYIHNLYSHCLKTVLDTTFVYTSNLFISHSLSAKTVDCPDPEYSRHFQPHHLAQHQDDSIYGWAPHPQRMFDNNWAEYDQVSQAISY